MHINHITFSLESMASLQSFSESKKPLQDWASQGEALLHHGVKAENVVWALTLITKGKCEIVFGVLAGLKKKKAK